MKNLNEIGKMTIDFDSWRELIPVKRITDFQEIMFLDLRYTREPIEEVESEDIMIRHFNEEEILNPQFLFPEEEGYQNVVSVDVYSKNFIIEKDLNLEEMRKDFLKNVIQLSNKNKEILNNFSFNKKDDSKKLLDIINMVSNYIYFNGRIGQATNILVSEENYHKYNLKTIDEDIKDPYVFTEADPFGEENWGELVKKYTITIEDIEDIIVYRKNNIDQPGLLLSYNDEKYNFLQLGFYPDKQFFKIILK